MHKIEKSGMTPTIASLMKIAAALGKSVSFFVDEPSTPDVNVVRADDRAAVYTSKSGLDLRNISGRYGPFQIAGAEAVAEPYADSGPMPMNHPGEELVIVTEGEMVFTVDGERHELGAGDSIHFGHDFRTRGQILRINRRGRSGSWCAPRSHADRRRGRGQCADPGRPGGDVGGAARERARDRARGARRCARLGHEVVLTHGNGPHVGSLLLQNKAGEAEAEPLPLDALIAMTQGWIGYLLEIELRRARSDACRSRCCSRA